MIQGFEVRPARESDIPLLQGLDPNARSNEWRRTFIRDAVDANQCWVASETGGAARPLGYGVLNQSFFGQDFIALVMVRESARRKGVGTAILTTLEAQCRGNRVFTSTNVSNFPMCVLLTSLGYAESGFIENLDETDPEIVFVKRF